MDEDNKKTDDTEVVDAVVDNDDGHKIEVKVSKKTKKPAKAKKEPKEEPKKSVIPVVSDDEPESEELTPEDSGSDDPVEAEETGDEEPRVEENTEDFESEDSADEPEENADEEVTEEVYASPEDGAEESSTDEDEANDETEQELDPETTIEEAIEKSVDDLPEGTKSDAEMDAAVDDIVRSDSDEAIKEAGTKTDFSDGVTEKKSFISKVKSGIARWWGNKIARYTTLGLLLLSITALILVPATRYGALNAFGVRVSSSMTIIDSQTRLPLKNIAVSLQGNDMTTDGEGHVAFDDLNLGNSSLSIIKRGYADNSRQIVLGWGSNPIGEQELVATGEQFTFVLSDWQSLAAVTEAEATAGENSAQADADGKIVLTVGDEDISSVEVVISAVGFRDEIVTSDQLVDGDIEVMMVPDRKHVFVSNRNGEYDLYKSDLDAKNEEILLKATGKEREVPRVFQHPERNLVAYTSSREGEQNSDGFILEGLFLVNSDTGASDRIARSEQLQVLGWSGDSIVFWQVVEGTSRGNPERSKLISYNQRTGERVDLAAANYFNAVSLVDDKAYYAVSSFSVPVSKAKLYSVNVNGDSNNKLVDSQVWSIYRTAHDTLLFSAVDQKWYEQVGNSDIEELSEQQVPSSLNFVDSPNGLRTAWVETRDGKGVLLESSIGNFEEQQVLSISGLNEVLYWVNDSTIVYRVISSDETADYVLNLDGGESLKITDVTASRVRF